jgi:phosphoribosylformylglycinamidine cyclo-ligase
VDIDAGNEAVRRIRRLVASTRRPEQLSDIGGFAGMMGLPAGLAEPVLVSCADGVGTKLLVAIAMGRHDTVGIDLVAMNVNDLVVTGALPLFLLDYIATGKLDPDVVERLVTGIVEGCRQSGCSLLGGETAELPDLYADGHYDLAAFAVGVVDRARMITPARVREGDVALGLASSGLHSNGYTLARRALLDPTHGGLRLEQPLQGTASVGETVGEALLRPTRIYVSAVAALLRLEDDCLHGAAHITGGGLLENPQRALPSELAVELDLRDVPRPPILQRIAAAGVPESELRRTFNCGVGMIVYVPRERQDQALEALHAAGEDARVVGRIVRRDGTCPDGVRFRE